jgi:hypothetical protein
VATPKTALTGMAWQGYYFDTEGNVFVWHNCNNSSSLNGDGLFFYVSENIIQEP